MNPVFGWALAVIAVAAGYTGWGWPGVALAVTVVAFWLLLQFSKAMRVLRAAGQRPVGHIDSAVMLNSRLAKELQMMQVIGLTKSLGQKLGDEPETWRWADAGGDAVEVEMTGGRVTAWRLQRASADAEVGVAGVGGAEGAAPAP